MSETISFTEQRTYSRLSCTECSINVLLTKAQEDHLRASHRNFYCLNGHGQHFTAKTEADRLRDALRQKTLEHERAERQRQAAEVETRKITDRVKQGVCPCCTRTFKQLAAHMQRKHPEYKK